MAACGSPCSAAISARARRRGCATNCMTGSLRDAFVIVNEAAETPVDDVAADALVAHRRAGRRLRLLHGARRPADAAARRSATSAAARRRATSGCSASCWRPAGSPIPARSSRRSAPIRSWCITSWSARSSSPSMRCMRWRSCAASRSAGARSRSPTGLIVTKIDEAEEGALARLLATLQTINPGAAISGAVKGSRGRAAAMGRCRAGIAARSVGRGRAAGDLSDKAGHRRDDRLDGLQRLAVGAAACARRRRAARQGRGAHAGRAAARAERAQDRAIAGDRAGAGRWRARARTTPSS